MVEKEREKTPGELDAEARAEVFRFFLENPERSVSEEDLAGILKVTKSRVRGALEDMMDLNLLVREGEKFRRPMVH